MDTEKHDPSGPGGDQEIPGVLRTAIGEMRRRQPLEESVDRVIVRALGIPSLFGEPLAGDQPFAVATKGSREPGGLVRLKVWNRMTRWMGGLTVRQRITLGGVGVAAGLTIVLVWLATAVEPVTAMEKMAENIRKAKSYTCTVIVKIKDDSPEPGRPPYREFTNTEYWLAPGSFRIDCKEAGKDGGPYRTEISPAGRPSIAIEHRNKKFSRHPPLEKNSRGQTLSIFNDLELLGEFSGKADRELGTKEINGKTARGFQIAMQKMVEARYARPGLAEIWIDTESNLPVVVRYSGLKGLKMPSQTTTIERPDIQWNLDLDRKLFDTTPPEGYVDDTHTSERSSVEQGKGSGGDHGTRPN